MSVIHILGFSLFFTLVSRHTNVQNIYIFLGLKRCCRASWHSCSSLHQSRCDTNGATVFVEYFLGAGVVSGRKNHMSTLCCSCMMGALFFFRINDVQTLRWLSAPSRLVRKAVVRYPALNSVGMRHPSSLSTFSCSLHLLLFYFFPPLSRVAYICHRPTSAHIWSQRTRRRTPLFPL